MCVRVPKGRYKPKDFIKTFNTEVERAAGASTVKTKMRYDPYSNRIQFSVASGEVVIIDNPRLRRMLGMRRHTTTFSNADADTKRLFIMHKLCTFNANGTMMFVYSDIIEPSLVGNTMSPLLCTVHLELDRPMETLHRKYTSIHYFLLRKNVLDMVEVHLANVHGKDMEFYGGESSLVVHFHKVG